MDSEATELQLFVEEFEAELSNQSDRGLVIVGATGLDILLERLLGSIMNSELPRDDIFGVNAPLNELASRVRLAFVLGLISRDEQRELQLIRKIRNLTAHEVKASLSTPRLRDMCMELKMGLRLYTPEEFPSPNLEKLSGDAHGYLTVPNGELPELDLSMPDPSNPRVRFTASIRILLRALSVRAFDAPAKRPPAMNFENAEGLWSRMVMGAEDQLVKAESLVQNMVELRNGLATMGKTVIDEDDELDDLKSQMREARAMLLIQQYKLALIQNARIGDSQAE